MLSADELITQAVDEYSDMVYRIAFNITKSTQDAYDVAQEVFLRLIKNREKIKNNDHLKPWLIRTAVNCSKTYAKNNRRRSTVSLDDIRELAAENNETETVIEYVMLLPEKYRTALYLFYYEDMPISDISKALGVTQSAVKLRLKRGREKLKEILQGEGYND